LLPDLLDDSRNRGRFWIAHYDIDLDLLETHLREEKTAELSWQVPDPTPLRMPEPQFSASQYSKQL
jgi:hypothetical protein